MKYYLVVAYLSLSLHSYADEKISFSVYSKSLRLVAVKENNLSAEFKGTVSISGLLEIDFEKDEATFHPDAISLEKLPKVINGSHPGAPDSIWIGNGRDVLNLVLSKKQAIELIMQKSEYFEAPAMVTIKDLRTGVECDHRVYGANLVSIKLIKERVSSSANLYGC